MAKIKIFKIGEGHVANPEIQYHYFCKGCEDIHAISPKVHAFNGDFDKPTFTPSVLQNFTPGRTCHSFIKDGKIQYLSDCWHSLACQTIELPEI